jgi:ATP-dependent DNA helicase RecG
MVSLERLPVTTLKGVGPRLAEKLGKLGLHSVQDVLFHLPTRYLDRTRVTPLGALQPNTSAVIEGEIRACDITYGRRRSLVCRLQDDTGTVSLRFFHFSAAQKNRLLVGTRLRCFGEARRGASGLEFYHPEYEFLDEEAPQPLEARLTPVYPATEGLTQPRLRTLAAQAVACLDHHPLAELLPEALRRQLHQVPLVDALRYLHAPPRNAQVDHMMAGEHPYQRRLAYEELLAHHLSLLLLRRQTQVERAPQLVSNQDLEQSFLQQLPFQLTGAQRRVCAEIATDLAKRTPMLRLLQGDVGSGKTLVAALAALTAVGSGYQVAIMAPTEILAEQHRNNFGAWLEPLGIELGWLTGRLSAGRRRAEQERLASGEAQVVVGTHALFQEDVVFANLGLIIIDEQHRFGVHQRLSLRQKGARGSACPHQLIMTATPIPRTLSMSAYADLDTSVIDELPPGRTPVTTVIISQERRGQVVERVREACAHGRQAYWVCTLIEESETLSAQAAEATAQSLREALPGLSVGLVHGRLKGKEKEAAMAAFKVGETDLLVATTVIEVGVDVPNASLMIIENPERLGLAQLHQLRGRVGRGAEASHCVLLYGSPLSRQSRERLRVMRESSDGFVIAEEDLRLRGPGEVLGTRQTGDMQFKIADLLRDADLLPQVQRGAQELLREHPAQCQHIVQRWLGENRHYLQV